MVESVSRYHAPTLSPLHPNRRGGGVPSRVASRFRCSFPMWASRPVHIRKRQSGGRLTDSRPLLPVEPTTQHDISEIPLSRIVRARSRIRHLDSNHASDQRFGSHSPRLLFIRTEGRIQTSYSPHLPDSHSLLPDSAIPAETRGYRSSTVSILSRRNHTVKLSTISRNSSTVPETQLGFSFTSAPSRERELSHAD